MPLIRTIRLNPNRMFMHLVLIFVSFMLTILLLTRLPDNIGLKAVSSNLSRLPDYGINGGFFWEGQLLSLAVINDRPVRGNQGEYGSGWYNIDRPRGTLVWDEARKVFSIQVVESAEELIVADRTRYWAQGGVSMGLRNEARWAAQAVSEEMPVIDERRMRSGIAYDTANNVYLVVAPTPCTGAEFRNALRERIGEDRLVDGIFLDGDGSSQLRVAKALLPGDHREVYQMITLLR